ncbi:hypothetical protein RJT34_13327 [Clitoria ternatea]|uniref:Uncharacterized protein n=1 Tax=Clitoria ternatea TaxID=43366 RepID=A0AAN9JRB9_CLITE
MKCLSWVLFGYNRMEPSSILFRNLIEENPRNQFKGNRGLTLRVIPTLRAIPTTHQHFHYPDATCHTGAMR